MLKMVHGQFTIRSFLCIYVSGRLTARNTRPYFTGKLCNYVIKINAEKGSCNPFVFKEMMIELNQNGEQMNLDSISDFLKNHILGIVILTVTLGLFITFLGKLIWDDENIQKKTQMISSEIVQTQKTYLTKSKLVNYMTLLNPMVAQGSTLRLSINSNSSQIRAFGLFPSTGEGTIRAEAHYNETKGGIYINFKIPNNMFPKLYEATIFIQELGGMNQEKHIISFEVKKSLEYLTKVPEDLSLNSLGFIKINGGKFAMGSNSGNRDESPSHTVSVDEFSIMDHELTRAELLRLILDYPNLPNGFTSEDFNVDGPTSTSQYPASLTYQEALASAEALSDTLGKQVRLPTEAEWEYAARGGLTQKKYSWGNDHDVVGGEKVIDIVGKIQGSCGWQGMTAFPVKSATPPNGYGLYDLMGNVWEWTSSGYKEYPYEKNDGREDNDYPGFKVIRGGGNAPESCDVRVSFRGFGDDMSRYGTRFVFEQ